MAQRQLFGLSDRLQQHWLPLTYRSKQHHKIGPVISRIYCGLLQSLRNGFFARYRRIAMMTHADANLSAHERSPQPELRNEYS